MSFDFSPHNYYYFFYITRTVLSLLLGLVHRLFRLESSNLEVHTQQHSQHEVSNAERRMAAVHLDKSFVISAQSF